MIKSWMATLNDLGILVLNAFLLPGNLALSQVSTHFPEIASQLELGAEEPGILLPMLVSVLIWTLLLLLFWRIATLVEYVAQIIKALAARACSLLTYRLRSLKARTAYKLRRMLPARESGMTVSTPDKDFDDLDRTVLRTGAQLPPGLLLSAPELAGQLTKRPAQVQRSLDKLRKYKLVDNVIGETDGFENYRLTESGIHLAASWLPESRVS